MRSISGTSFKQLVNYQPISLLLISALALLVSINAVAIPMDERLLAGEGPWVVRVYDVHTERMTELQAAYDVWGGDSDDAYAILGIKSKDELDRLRASGFQFAVDPVATERYKTPLMLGFGGGTIPNFPCYRTVEETFATAQQIASGNPQLAELIDIGDSWEKTQNGNTGYDLSLIHI